ncbi:sensor histidine kinase [Streptomyces sp. NPDC051018]|uniref:sensor histidine kinase n=1 Tax=Streptomyces sp. NPDC051018 TaxID=3365639 RepID=UPI003797A6E9
MARHTARSGRLLGAAALAVAAVAPAALATPSVSALIRCSTTTAVLAAVVLLVWAPGEPQRRILATVPVTCAISLLATLRYEGPADNTSALWILVETGALLAVALPAVRSPAPAQAAMVALALMTAITLLPLRITLTLEPPAGARQTIVLCLVWGVVAGAAVGASCYLRSLDSRRRLALRAERRAQRLKVARDLHDFAAHDVTGVMVLAQAAQALARESPERALALLPGIEHAGVQALESMDRTIRILSELDADPREDPGDEELPAEGTTGRVHSLAELPDLIDRFSRTGLIPARLDLAPGVLDGLPEPVGSAGYRTVAEALTNVRRHAAASPRVAVRAERTVLDGTALRIVVDNEPVAGGAGHGSLTAEREYGGTGLRELRRRVAELGGELTAGPTEDGGWRVTAVLPLDDGAPENGRTPIGTP